MAETLPVAFVIHATDGRTRIRVDERREDAVFFASAARGLAAIPGVRKVEVRPLTGSILVFHDASLRHVGEAAEKRGLFSLVKGTATSRPPDEPALHFSPRIIAAAGLGFVALWQVYKEKFFPSALSVALYAANVAGLLSAKDASSDRE